MKVPSVLVTGGAGYIGAHTAKALSAAGYLPVVLDDLSSGHRDSVKWGPFVLGDIANRDLLCTTIENYQIESVVHLAASAYVSESVHNPRKYFDNNVSKSLTLMDVLIEQGIRSLVFSSSCATYGSPLTRLITESHPQIPLSPYGDSKLFIEKAARWHEAAYGLRTVCLRFFNAAGADPGGELGESHQPETHLIPNAINAALDSQSSFIIYGTDFDTPDGTAIRDFVHVSDIASAHVSALHYLESGNAGACFNLGSGTGYSVRQIIDWVERLSNSRVKTTISPARRGDPSVLLASAESAKSVLQWMPKFSSIEQILTTAIQWHSSQRSLSENARLPVSAC